MSREAKGVVELSIPAKAEYIVLCRLALTGLARRRALDPEVLADLKLALTEACSNSIRHAYADGREGTVEVRYELAADRLSIEVLDEGSGFDPEIRDAGRRRARRGRARHRDHPRARRRARHRVERLGIVAPLHEVPGLITA